MNELLRAQLRSAGWQPGTFRGFLMVRRAGIEFQVGPARASKTDGPDAPARLELRYRYVTEGTRAEGEEVLPGGAGMREIEDAMTGIYLRVHERPDVTRVFGSRRRIGAGGPPAGTRPAASPEPPEDEGQASLDLF